MDFEGMQFIMGDGKDLETDDGDAHINSVNMTNAT